jgi:hypothetical protein
MADLLRCLITRRFSAWQKVVALAPLLLLAVYLPGQTLLRCRIDGLVRPSCCCPQEQKSQGSDPVIKAQDCCDREVTATERPAIEAAGAAGRDLVWASAVATITTPSIGLVASPAERSAWAWQRHGPAREGPSLVLLKHAFLI